MGTVINTPEALPTPKQIRFVNNQGHPPTKRRRINAAKTRCAGEHPVCSTCTKNGHVCLGYSDAVEKKKDSNGVDGPAIDPSGTHVAADEDDYTDDKLDLDHKQLQSNRHRTIHFDSPGDGSRSGHVTGATNEYATSTTPVKPEKVEWEDQPPRAQSQPRSPNLIRQSTNPRHQSFSTEDGHSTTSRSSVQQHSESHRVPYFRFFGPTAIVPGFKQMVVKVRDRRTSSMSATSPGAGSLYSGFMSSLLTDPELGHLDDMPVYDPNDKSPVHAIILSLIDTFFVHLGSNYPFLNRKKFPKMVQEKRVEPILVDAVCALAARFSDLSLFAKWNDGKLAKSEYGSVYSQRAKSAVVDTFPCPSVSAVQACLLMAYDGFGADQDSALWMYLGIAIRMAVDLGLTKEDGVKYRGEKDPWYTRSFNRKAGEEDVDQAKPDDEDTLSPKEQKEVEQERIDTLWAVFFLDRVISSGTGRPVTLKDEDLELELPKSAANPSGWPDPVPLLYRIIHLYGRVSDVLNKVGHASDLTQDKLEKLGQMETELTKLHQRTDPRLRFDANNFQAAKTIADILAFAQLVDPRCFIGNPFTSQPIYIAANAFLMESVTNGSQPHSRDTTPSDPKCNAAKGQHSKNGTVFDPKPTSRHLLLASAANQNYQACYKALKQMHEYWGGVRYIITALDQKSEGIWDCETFTVEEYESTKRPRQSSAIRRLAGRPEYPPSPIPESGPPLAWSLTGTTNSPNSSLTLLFQNPVGHGPVVQSQPAPVPASAATPPGNMIYDPIRQSLPETTTMYPPASPYPQPNTSALRHSVNHSQPHRVSNSSLTGKTLQRYAVSPQGDSLKSPTTPESRLQPLGISAQGAIAGASASFTPTSQQSSGFEYQAGTSPTSTAHVNGTNSNTASAVGSVYSPTEAGPSNFAQSGSGLASSGYSYLGPAGSNLHLLTYDNETDISQHLASFEQNEMMSWFGDYFPYEVLGFYSDPNIG
ncbi:hypothetical protein DL766_002149 [Monosporascus sp. MC13-8B]|uniref:Xylanolytic transcriptional activator regulatory domain-containing protein n=1 Tax=Monosporascus cannonballus TaxID=155416 RepID=A0ABY0HL31_9PEZI|nr:hypothetical protein DL763_007941 [Monosporascus cannonballus]RYO93210.1 hypothetical protein DL762_001159 [Monosporascus cannonballus]RYP36100.1 hypothetical protein DL766_002149 [Monosporascus sp. MC13-8B]